MTKSIDVTPKDIAEAITVTLNERNEFRMLLLEIKTAYTSGALKMQSHDVGDPENGIPVTPWHEEWMQGVREALGEKGDE